LQGTYKFGKFKPGLSYGESSLDLASNETNPNLVKKNKSAVLGLYYSLTQSLNLVGEYIQTKATNQAGVKTRTASSPWAPFSFSEAPHAAGRARGPPIRRNNGAVLAPLFFRPDIPSVRAQCSGFLTGHLTCSRCIFR